MRPCAGSGNRLPRNVSKTGPHPDRRGVVAIGVSAMRIWPVLLDSRPAYLRGPDRSASLLLAPLGAETLIEHLVSSLAPITENPPVVLSRTEADSEVPALGSRGLSDRARCRAAGEACRTLFESCELSDAFLVIDPRCLPSPRLPAFRADAPLRRGAAGGTPPCGVRDGHRGTERASQLRRPRSGSRDPAALRTGHLAVHRGNHRDGDAERLRHPGRRSGSRVARQSCVRCSRPAVCPAATYPSRVEHSISARRAACSRQTSWPS